MNIHEIGLATKVLAFSNIIEQDTWAEILKFRRIYSEIGNVKITRERSWNERVGCLKSYYFRYGERSLKKVWEYSTNNKV